MRILIEILLLTVILNQGILNEKKVLNQFTSSSDTLLIRTEKQKGNGLFSSGVTDIHFRDTVEVFPYSVKYPKQITNFKRIQMSTDFGAAKPNYVDIISGKRGEEEVFIVDENNNKDLTDDSIRIFKPIKWRSNIDLIKCKYLISNGLEIVEDSSWIRIGTIDNDIYYGRSEHLIANFTLNKLQYSVGVIDSRAGDFVYGYYPEIALLSSNNELKDTLLQKDILKLGEFINLNGNYYRFQNITNNGEFITLIKENNFDKETGIQVGMIAPDFECKTVAGDTAKSSMLHDRIIVIANSCGCGGDRLSTEAYYEMRKEYANDIYIFRLDSKIEKGVDGFQIDMEEKFNSDIYNKFRNAYCSRNCYVIDKSNRIIDRFPVSDWKLNLPRHIQP